MTDQTKLTVGDAVHGNIDMIWDTIALLEAAAETPEFRDHASLTGVRLIQIALERVREFERIVSPLI